MNNKLASGELLENEFIVYPLPSHIYSTINYYLSLHNVIVLVLHSLVGRRRSEPFVLAGRFQFVPEAPYLPGAPLLGGGHPAADSRRRCAFLIESTKNRARGTILSPTYPGAYPNVSNEINDNFN
jgi:hypothetical protein